MTPQPQKEYIITEEQMERIHRMVLPITGLSKLVAEDRQALMQAIRSRPAPSHETCIWTQNEEEYGNYETECGHAFQTIEGDVKENNFKFCTYCGRKIQEEMR